MFTNGDPRPATERERAFLATLEAYDLTGEALAALHRAVGAGLVDVPDPVLAGMLAVLDAIVLPREVH